MMKTTSTVLKGFALLSLSALLFSLMIGCSSDAPMSSYDSGVYIAPPPLTAQHIAEGPAPGYSFVKMNTSSNSNEMTAETAMYAQVLLLDDVGGSLFFTDPQTGKEMNYWHGMVIGEEAIHEDIVAEMRLPDPEVAAIDFAPSPYQFDADVSIELSYMNTDLLEGGASPKDLVIMWWDYNRGEYVLVPSILKEREQKLIGSVDHFSRYIIATGSGD
jgi:hypothetical protein